MTTLPAEIKFGKVVGRWAMAVADAVTGDQGEYPDIAFPTGSVTFARLDVNTVLLDTLQDDGTFIGIARKNVVCELGPDGEIRLAGKTVGGVWLAVGHWQVTPVIAESNWTAFPILVEETHTALAPLDLLAWSPIVETPTVVLVASIETALRAEAAADRAEAAADRAEGAELTYASLGDVDTTGLADGDAMVWDQASGKWVRVSLSSTYVAQPAAGDPAGLTPLSDGAGGYSWQPGADGLPGADGEDGREVKLQTSATHVQWRYVGDVAWIDLIALTAITGPAGADGAAGADGDDGLSVELQTTATHIQWRQAGGTWADLVALSTITGPAGADGADGADGEDGADGADADTSGQFAVNIVAASGAAETLPATHAAHKVTMDEDCTFTFTSPTAGHAFVLYLSGAFTPTWPASVDWAGGTAPTYASGTLYHFVTVDGGTTWLGSGQAYS